MLVFFCFVLAGVGSCVWSCWQSVPPGVPPRVVLELDLERVPVELEDASWWSELRGGGQGVALRTWVRALDRAAADERVVGLFARVGAGGAGMARSEELRAALLRFRASGKAMVAFSESFGEAAPGQAGYWLATAFDTLWLQPSGDLGLSGFSAETPFFHDLLERMGVNPRFAGRKEYKTFINTFTERDLTAPHRESLRRVLDVFNARLREALVAQRNLSEEEAEAALSEGPHGAPEALRRRLVDHLGYRDQALSDLAARVGAPAERLYVERYAERAAPDSSGASDVIALVSVLGMITRGKSTLDPLSGDATAGSDDVTAALRAATRAPEVKAIVIRVDSPGGSWVASDAIRREVERAREAGKPVVVSMGNMAASGGYAVSMSASRIIANSTTLTGSIGVGGGKMVLDDLWQKIGVHWGRIETTPDTGMFSLMRDFTPAEWERFGRWLDRIYADFVAHVARGRALDPAAVEEAARGRVWTGEDALAHGLVDALGGLEVAIAAARDLAGIPAHVQTPLRTFPEARPFWQALLAQLNREEAENSDSWTGAASVRAGVPSLRGVWYDLLQDVASGRDGWMRVPTHYDALTRY